MIDLCWTSGRYELLVSTTKLSLHLIPWPWPIGHASYGKPIQNSAEWKFTTAINVYTKKEKHVSVWNTENEFVLCYCKTMMCIVYEPIQFSFNSTITLLEWILKLLYGGKLSVKNFCDLHENCIKYKVSWYKKSITLFLFVGRQCWLCEKWI